MKKKTVAFLITILFALLTLASAAEAREVNLQWDPNSEPDISHYVVYWGTESGNYTEDSGDIGNVTTYTCELPDDGNVYFFAVTAVDTSGLESDYSNEVQTSPWEEVEEWMYSPPAQNSSVELTEEPVSVGNGITISKIGDRVFINFPTGMVLEVINGSITVITPPTEGVNQ